MMDRGSISTRTSPLKQRDASASAPATRPFEGERSRILSVKIADLRPIQMTVGFREVSEKRQRWRAAIASEGDDAFRNRTVPVVLGPGGEHYILDRHHWLCALDAEGVTKVPVAVVGDLQALNQAAFWRVLEWRGWRPTHDAEGRRPDYCDIPASITGLRDDPFRSLASALRRVGGYAKIEAQFSDLLWANFLRRHIARDRVNNDFDAALLEAQALARGRGWNGGADGELLIGISRDGFHSDRRRPAPRGTTPVSLLIIPNPGFDASIERISLRE